MAPDAAGSTYLIPGPAGADAAWADLPVSVRRRFLARYGEPTAAQRTAWPALARGENLLVAAPTGTGKTLAAFLPILSGDFPGDGSVRCLYVAPLKALINDVRANLETYLRYCGHATRVPAVRSLTGDTPQKRRRAVAADPPDVLLTTPESLAVLLSRPGGASLFRRLRWIVVDEVHALASDKRGADLSLSLERLHDAAEAPPRRIGLAPACVPLEPVARFLVGVGRPCAVARTADRRLLDLVIEPLNPFGRTAAPFLHRLLDRLDEEIQRNRTTLIFTNRRSLAERLAWALRQRRPRDAQSVGVHHSSLAASCRHEVEQALKEGRLRVVVTTASLELGIDIGSVDGAVLVHPPGDVVRLLQRVGRSGHGPDRPRRGLVLTDSPAQLLEAVVTGQAGRDGELEQLEVAQGPLDVLCQHLVGMACEGAAAPDDAFALARRAYPYRDLTRADFDGCLAYLSGLDRRGRAWLPPRLRWRQGSFTIADDGVARLLRRNLGTIQTPEHRPVRLVSGTVIGEVDEAFAERLRPGDRFVLDGRCLETRLAEGAAVVTEEVTGRPLVPRWQGAGGPLGRDLARRLYAFRAHAAEARREGDTYFERWLHDEYGAGPAVAAELAAFFEQQERHSEVPAPDTCLVESVPGADVCEVYVHTPLNRAANDALARLVVLRLARACHRPASSLVADLGFAIFASGSDLLDRDALTNLLSADDFEADLESALADCASLRERFHAVATTAFMVLRNPRGRRRRVGGPTWPEHRLFDQVRSADPNFVLLRQARREVMGRVCDAAAARQFLATLPRRAIRWRTLAAVSPFAQAWAHVLAGRAETLDTSAEVLRRLHETLTLSRTDHACAG